MPRSHMTRRHFGPLTKCRIGDRSSLPSEAERGRYKDSVQRCIHFRSPWRRSPNRAKNVIYPIPLSPGGSE